MSKQAADAVARRGPDAPRVSPIRPPDRAAVFKKTPQGELKMFAYLPDGWKASDRRAAIVFFFGGGFTKGTPEQFFSKAEYLASRGMVAFSAEYRVHSVHGTTMEACLEDAKSAMRWVRAHSSEWGVDPARFVASGGSAGATMSAQLALVPGYDAEDEGMSISCKPQATVLFNPVLDLLDPVILINIPAFMDRVAGATPDSQRASLKSLSPIEFVTKGCAPALVFFGTRDNFLGRGREFIAKSAKLGNRIELWTAEGEPHGFFNRSPWHESTLIRTDEFLSSLGYLSGPPTIKPADAKATLRKE